MLACCHDAKPKFVATLLHYKLIFAGWSRKWHGGVASIKPFRDGRVIGAVYEISEKDLRLLDKHEGHPTVYDRRNVVVITKDGVPVEAVTYIKREQSEETQPSQQYLEVLRQGYKDWGTI